MVTGTECSPTCATAALQLGGRATLGTVGHACVIAERDERALLRRNRIAGELGWVMQASNRLRPAAGKASQHKKLVLSRPFLPPAHTHAHEHTRQPKEKPSRR